ncbi:DNA starvation/stationary phase protection protein [Novosphingobium marinum]|uniref:Starvation-inducible DNA-binding protein n=1 Tax=Novosphingobium marinum TaxID=1514948 RepID=A0A7Y9XZW7_9SPHN|nr:DNA starvation/stationary phase protection protein [Novosphingobium marinum]NYH96046.1 starvation-inducible DNA-binding protein [Novosphingobium marinum]GGC32008.1 DNA starvation/stationary phase protection protein [Novosphingobium marinum]
MSNPKDNATAALVDSLNGLLADYFALYMKTKSFHWHVAGPQFRDLHLLFDEQAQEMFALTDTIAERVRKLGGDTLTSIGAIGGKSTIKDQNDTSLNAMDMVRELRDDNAALVASLKRVKDAAGEAGDNATDGLIDDWTDEAEERVWFLSQITR